MNLNTVLRLQLDETAVEFSTDREELRSAIACIFRAFVVGDENCLLPSLDRVPDGGPWRRHRAGPRRCGGGDRAGRSRAAPADAGRGAASNPAA